MQIFVKADKTYVIEVESTDTIDQLTHVIYNKTRIPSKDQVLQFGKTQLEHERTVMDYGIKGDDTIHVRHRTRGADVFFLKRSLSKVLKCTPKDLGLQEKFRVMVTQDITGGVGQMEDDYQGLIMPEFKVDLDKQVSVVRKANDTHYLGFYGNNWGYFETKYAQVMERVPAAEKEKKAFLSRLFKRPSAIPPPPEAIRDQLKDVLLFDEHYPKGENGRSRVTAHYDLLPLDQEQFCRTMKITLRLTRGARHHLTSFTLYIYFDVGFVSKVDYLVTSAAINASVDAQSQQTNDIAENPLTPKPMKVTNKDTRFKGEHASAQVGVNYKVALRATYAVDKGNVAITEAEAERLTAASITPSGNKSRSASWVVKQDSLRNGIPLDNHNLIFSLELDSIPLIVGYTIEAFTVVAYQDTQQHSLEEPMLSTISRAQCLNTEAFYEIPR